jgi:hypothetical protein
MIQVIQEALKQGDERCMLLGRDTDVNPNAGIFVTLNPAGKGYGGRSKLPDNLKQLFRAVAMAAPDNQLITETILFSEGFENASELATRVKAETQMPLALGFGISRPEHVRAIGQWADAAVVGSALVKVIAEHGQAAGLLDEVERYVRWLRN